MSCLDDATLAALVSGELESGRLSAADEHMDGCADCRALVTCLLAGDRAAAGRRLGRYTLLARAGAGGMGDVWAAWDPELERRVAVKVLRDEATRAEHTRREAQAMARLTHPGVVAVYEVGRDEASSSTFIAMEWVAGRTLRAWLAEKPRGWPEVRDVFLAAGAALAAAHKAGIVHRDFKPENVFVDESGAVKVGDFGLALVAGGDHGTRVIAGTPRYMAPEQRAGGVVDARSDQWAFATSLREGVEAAAGKPPAWLAEVLAKALAEEPARRFADMEELLLALRHDARVRARRGLALAAAAFLVVGGGAYLAGRAPGSEAGAGGATAGAAVDPCAGGAAVFDAVWSDARRAAVRTAFAASGAPDPDGALARLDADLARRRTAWLASHRGTCEARLRGELGGALADARMHCLSRRLAELDALVDVFARADRDAVLGARDALAALPDEAECADAAPLAAVEPPPAGAEARAAVAAVEQELAALRAEAAAGAWAAVRERAAALAEKADAAGWGVLAGEAHLLAAQLARRAGKFADADAAAGRALAAAEGARDDLGAVRAGLELAAVAAERGALGDAELWLRAADAALARARRPERLVAAWQHLAGQVALDRGRFDDAARELDAALATRRRLLGDAHPDVARTLTAIGNLRRARGDLAGALAAHDEALAVDLAALGADHPALARHHHNRGGVLRLLGRPDDAMAAYQRAAVLERAGHGDAHPALGLTANSMGLVELDRGRDAAARAHFERALVLLAEHPDRAAVLHNLGLVAARLGEHKKAVAYFTQALELYPPQPDKRVTHALAARDRSLHALGRRAERPAPSVTPAPPKLPPPPPDQPTNASTYVPAKTWDAE